MWHVIVYILCGMCIVWHVYWRGDWSSPVFDRAPSSLEVVNPYTSPSLSSVAILSTLQGWEWCWNCGNLIIHVGTKKNMCIFAFTSIVKLITGWGPQGHILDLSDCVSNFFCTISPSSSRWPAGHKAVFYICVFVYLCFYVFVYLCFKFLLNHFSQ